MQSIIDIPFPSFIPTTVLGLLALLFWYLYNAYTNKNKTKIDELNTINQQERTKVIEMMLNDLGVTLDTSSLSAEQKYNLLIRILSNKTRKYIISAVTLLLLAVLTSFLIYMWQPKPVVQTKSDSSADSKDTLVPLIDSASMPLDTTKTMTLSNTHSSLIKVGLKSDCKFSSLIEAVNYSMDEDTILLTEGHYDTVTIRKGIKIFGIGDKHKIRAEGFKIVGKGNIEFRNLTMESVLFNTSDCFLTVEDCVIYDGIDMFSGVLDISFTTLKGISGSVFGIFLRKGYNCPDASATVKNCKIENFGAAGIATDSHTTITIDSSIITNNKIGIEVGAESDVTVKNSNLIGNSERPIKNGGTIRNGKEIFGTLHQENNELTAEFGH
jgi:hypothetical protein